MSADVYTWVAADGSETVIPVGTGISGLGAPVVDYQSTPKPTGHGAAVAMNRWAGRRISIPVGIAGADCATDRALGTRTLLRAWAKRLATTGGAGTLKIASVLGDVRQIGAYYVGGLEVVEATNRVVAATIELDCPEVFFEDAIESTASATTGTVTGTFFPFLPLRVSGSEIAAELTIVNDGDVEAWPVIAITGPAIAPTLRNDSTGLVIALGGTIGAGEIVTFDSRSGAKSVRRQDGTSLYSLLTSRQWWSLAPGSTRVRLEASGTTAATTITVRWRRRWLTK